MLNKYICLIFPLTLILSRKIELLLNPRMWAEEATIHLQNSFSSNSWEIISFVPNHIGYICLNINLATLATNMVGVENAAYITTYTAFLVQLLPHCIILLSNQSFWGTRIQRILLSSAIILIPIGTGETWLNTTCSHYHFGVLAFIILLDLQETMSRKTIIIYTILLCLGALSSPITCFLFPSYIIAKYLNKKRISYFILIPFSICCFIQSVISFINIREKQGLGATRFEGFNMFEFPSILINEVFIKGTLGEIGLKISLTFVRAISKLLSLEYHHIYWISCLAMIIGISLVLKVKKEISSKIILITFSFVSVFLLTYFSVSSSTSLLDRNALAPGVIFILLIFSISKNSKGVPIILFTSIYFLIAFYEFYKFDSVYYSDSWPTWSNEVEKWRLDSQYQPKVWPRNNEHWSFLSERDWRVTIPADTE